MVYSFVTTTGAKAGSTLRRRNPEANSLAAHEHHPVTMTSLFEMPDPGAIRKLSSPCGESLNIENLLKCPALSCSDAPLPPDHELLYLLAVAAKNVSTLIVPNATRDWRVSEMLSTGLTEVKNPFLLEEPASYRPRRNKESSVEQRGPGSKLRSLLQPRNYLQAIVPYFLQTSITRIQLL
jgi:hypothetical protein